MLFVVTASMQSQVCKCKMLAHLHFGNQQDIQTLTIICQMSTRIMIFVPQFIYFGQKMDKSKKPFQRYRNYDLYGIIKWC
jgi:hypothetical protein